jgi:hypothetical protein
VAVPEWLVEMEMPLDEPVGMHSHLRTESAEAARLTHFREFAQLAFRRQERQQPWIGARLFITLNVLKAKVKAPAARSRMF